MTTTIESAPSTPELLALASQIPPTGILTTPPPSVFPYVISTFRTKWLRQFLFSTSPFHLSHLSSPNLQLSAFLLSLTTTRVQPPSPQPNPHTPVDHSSHARSHFLFAPAFTADALTVGVGVLAGSDTRIAPWTSHLNPASQSLQLNFRFVRDANNQTLLLLCDLPALDLVTVFCSKLHTVTTNCSFTANFRRARLLEALDAGCKEDDVRQAALFIINEVRTRSCPMCATTDADGCTCTLTMPEPAHPFDAQHFREGFLQTLGTYEGLANKVLCGGDGEECQVSLGVRVQLRCVADADFVERLSKWSIAAHLQETPEDPRLSNVLTACEPPTIEYLLEAPHAADDYHSRRSSGPNIVLVTENGKDVTEGAGDAHSEPTIESAQQANAPESFSGINSFLATLAEPEQACDLSTDTNAVSADTTAPGSGELYGDDAWWDRHCNRPCARVYQDEDQPLNDLDRFTGRSNTASSWRAQDLPVSQCPLGEDTAKRRRADVKARERLRRAELRKERNRVSAQRSNLKRKAERDAIKMELRILNERIDFLRRREVRLRQENLLLRRSIVGS